MLDAKLLNYQTFNKQQLYGPVSYRDFRKRAPDAKFSTETRETRIILTFLGTELPQAKGPFIGPSHEGLTMITNIVTFTEGTYTPDFNLSL